MVSLDKYLRTTVKYFHLGRARQRGADQLESNADWGLTGGTPQVPDVFVTTLSDQTDYARADVVAIEVRTPRGALLTDVTVGTTGCRYLTPEGVASQASSAASRKQASAERGSSVAGSESANSARPRASVQVVWAIPGWQNAPARPGSAGSSALRVREADRSFSYCDVAFGPEVRSRAGELWPKFRDAHHEHLSNALKKARELTGAKVIKQTVNGVEYSRWIGFLRNGKMATVFVGLQEGRCVAYWFSGPTARLSQVMPHLGKAKLVAAAPKE